MTAEDRTREPADPGGSRPDGGPEGHAEGRNDADGQWVALFSGGKDSSFALWRAVESGLPVGRLLTVHPEGDSYMYHTPATELTALAAEAVGIDLVDVHPEEFAAAVGPDAEHDSDARGEREIAPLEAALADLDRELPGGVAGVTAGAVASEYQTSRIAAMSDRLGVDTFTPIWQRDPWTVAGEMLDAGFEVLVLQVAAAGLDRSWLGRRWDREALDELRELNEEYGVHPLGEGGEFETFVLDGPHMDRRVELDHEPVWEGTRGHLRITDARLAGDADREGGDGNGA